MRIFISQSGERSAALALAIESFLRVVVPGAQPWVSATGIEKGARWGPEVSKSLDEAHAGMICLVAENLTEPWILFEAGALSRRLSDKLWTILLDIDHAQVELPLGQFQHTKADKDDFFKAVSAINRGCERPHKDEDLRKVFDAMWPLELGPKIAALRATGPAKVVPARSMPAMVEELLEGVRLLRRHADKNVDFHIRTFHFLRRQLSEARSSQAQPARPVVLDDTDRDFEVADRTLERAAKELARHAIAVGDHTALEEAMRHLTHVDQKRFRNLFEAREAARSETGESPETAER